MMRELDEFVPEGMVVETPRAYSFDPSHVIGLEVTSRCQLVVHRAGGGVVIVKCAPGTGDQIMELKRRIQLAVDLAHGYTTRA